MVYVAVTCNAEISCLAACLCGGWGEEAVGQVLCNLQASSHSRKSSGWAVTVGILAVGGAVGQDRTAEQKLALTPLFRTNVAITALGTLASTAYLPGPTQWCRGSPLGFGARSSINGY